LPCAAASDDRRLIVADTSKSQVVMWHGVPREGAGPEADSVLAQSDLDENGENRWPEVADYSLCWLYGLSLAGNILAIAVSGNNRVMFWRPD
jgi:hypothetical protein